jgi:hypothetical protein
MTSRDFILKSREIVRDYTNEHMDKSDNYEIGLDDTYVVWYSKALQNHKGLFSTEVTDGMYYEVTYNGEKNELYFDAYKKFENKCFEMNEVRNLRSL